MAALQVAQLTGTYQQAEPQARWTELRTCALGSVRCPMRFVPVMSEGFRPCQLREVVGPETTGWRKKVRCWELLAIVPIVPSRQPHTLDKHHVGNGQGGKAYEHDPHEPVVDRDIAEPGPHRCHQAENEQHRHQARRPQHTLRHVGGIAGGAQDVTRAMHCAEKRGERDERRHDRG